MTSSLLPLLIWLSPSFPTGAFAYSHGLEWAVESGDVTDAESLQCWIADLLDHGGVRSDAILLKAAWSAAYARDIEALAHVNELALALSPSRERHLETSAQGNAFVAAARGAWPCAAFDFLGTAGQDDIAYPVAVGVAAAGHGIDLRATLKAFALGFCTNLVSAGLRLSVIGQADGQRIIADRCTAIEALADFAADSSLDDLGTCAFRSDIASMRHETQYSRLFRS
ncbi:MAG TPA: urease accessory protein UreF [Beijerinckia sp.]|jgi:urease accessory protein|nr:urease accessory protein UreF [Beijerinckia sp.]